MPATADASRRNARLTAELWVWNQQTGLGVVFDSSAGFTLPDAAVRCPDSAWVTRERWKALPREERDRFAYVLPDFVAELLSRSSKLSDLREKMEEYVDQGARLGWLIDPETGTVEIHRPGRPAEILQWPATLSGEDVLPGLALDLKGILFD